MGAPLRGPLIYRQHTEQATRLRLEPTRATLRDRQALSSLTVAASLSDSFLAASDRQKVSKTRPPFEHSQLSFKHRDEQRHQGPSISGH